MQQPCFSQMDASFSLYPPNFILQLLSALTRTDTPYLTRTTGLHVCLVFPFAVTLSRLIFMMGVIISPLSI